MAREKTICLDFDGVINSYKNGWNKGKLDDPPVPGAIKWLNRMIKTHEIILHSARLNDVDQIPIVNRWLRDNGATEETMEKLQWAKKPHADVYIDDRAFAFTGSNFPSEAEIAAFKPWNKQPEIAHDESYRKKKSINLVGGGYVEFEDE